MMKKHPLRFLAKIQKPFMNKLGYDLIKKDENKIIEIPVDAKISYSQTGEDLIIDFIQKTTGHKINTYLELGVQGPRNINNTYLFYKQGARGVLVEADPSLIENIVSVRPEDKVLNIAVSTVEKSSDIDFYVFNVGSGTCSEEEAKEKQKNGLVLEKVIRVKSINVNEIIKNNFKNGQIPDFLSIDIEGFDLDVLKSLDWQKYPIPIVCAETCLFRANCINEKDNEMTDFMLSKGYIAYADTYLNTIYVNKNWFNKCSKK